MGCEAVVGYNGQQNTEVLDTQNYDKLNFKAVNEGEAAKSYIWVDHDANIALEVRELAKPVRLIGEIILHSILAVTILFSRQYLQGRVCSLLQRPDLLRR